MNAPTFPVRAREQRLSIQQTPPNVLKQRYGRTMAFAISARASIAHSILVCRPKPSSKALDVIAAQPTLPLPGLTITVTCCTEQQIPTRKPLEPSPPSKNLCHLSPPQFSEDGKWLSTSPDLPGLLSHVSLSSRTSQGKLSKLPEPRSKSIETLSGFQTAISEASEAYPGAFPQLPMFPQNIRGKWLSM